METYTPQDSRVGTGSDHFCWPSWILDAPTARSTSTDSSYFPSAIYSPRLTCNVKVLEISKPGRFSNPKDNILIYSKLGTFCLSFHKSYVIAMRQLIGSGIFNYSASQPARCSRILLPMSKLFPIKNMLLCSTGDL